VVASTLPAEELLPADPRSPGLRFRASAAWGWVERWTAQGQGWQPVFRIAGQGIAAVLPSPHVGSDGAAYVLTQAGLFRSADRGDSWARCPEGHLEGRDYTNEPTTGAWAGDQLAVGTANGEILFIDPAALDCEPVELELSRDSWPSPVPVPWPTAQPGPSPTPTPTPTPIPETPRVSEQFAAAYADGWIAIRLHGPRAEAGTTQGAFQQFEHGMMIWRGDTKEIYVLYGDGSRDWPVYHDTWDESQPVDDPARVPPPGLFQPVRGFGKLWRTSPDLAAKLGWALAPEQGYEMLVQEFQGGTMLLGPQGDVYVLLRSWAWERR
jgi:hypothetical protein